MGLLDKMKSKVEDQQEAVRKKEEDYISLIRVYMQAGLAANLGITNLNMMPDLREFKVAMKVPTQNGRLGLGEKAAAKKLMQGAYGLSDDFFKEMDKSMSKNCKNMQQMQSFFMLFQGFLNDFMTLLTNHLGWKIRVPNFFTGIIRTTIETGVEEIFTKTNWDKADAFKMAQNIRTYNEKLGYTRSWMVELIYPFIMIAKGAKNVANPPKKA